LLKQLTKRIHQRTAFQVVAIEANLEGAGEEHMASLVFSPDGKGWTGTAQDVEYSCYIPGKPAFKLGVFTEPDGGDSIDNNLDPYKELGLNENASQDEIKKAYRNLARKYHPDLNPKDSRSEERFKRISAAFDIIGDRKKRTG
jgi:DnaJ-domain-containing protein 1